MRLLLPLLLSACAHQAVLERLAAVEQRLGVIEDALGVSSTSQEEEEAAAQLFQQASDLVSSDISAARTALQGILNDHPDTYAAQAAAQMLDQLRVVGTSVEGLEGVRWLKGSADLDGAPVTLLVFWEVWCPHCQRFVPALQPVADRYGADGLQVVSLTRMSHDVTEEQVLAFVSEHELTFAVGHEDGTMSEQLGVAGVPAAAAVRDGVVIWRGHPVEVDDAMIAGWLAR